MDFTLNEDQQAFQDTARAFAREQMAPYAADWDENKIFSKQFYAKAGELGFCGLYTPEHAGGMNLTRLDSAIVLEELAAGCTSTAAFISIHNMATWMIAQWGKESTIEQWCGDLTQGKKLASYCLTEPGAGSDAGSLRSTAKKQGQQYLLNGSKMFISGAGDTDVLVVMARTGTQEEGSAGISAFAIPAQLDGIHYGKNEAKMGWNSQPTRAISFENVLVDQDSLLGQEGEGFKIAMRGLDGGRINIATCSIGAAQACINHSQKYMLERQQFGKPLAAFQALQFKLADMLTELIAARQMVRLAASKLDADDVDKSTYCAMAKRFATDAGFNICNDAMQLHGGYGYLKEYPLERFMRDARVHQILEGTNEIMRVITARRLFEVGAPEALR